MQSYPQWPNLPAMMFDRARAWPRRPMLRRFQDGAWRGITWGQFARQTASVARGLRRAGIGPGDRVLIISENRPEYPITEVALMAIRAVPVPVYVTNTVADHAHILRDSGARAAIVSTRTLAARLREAASGTGGLDLLVVLDGDSDPSWSMLAGEDRDPGDIAAEAQNIPHGALACLIYTSGTGGAAKGVMLPHRSILANCRGAFRLLQSLQLNDEVYLSFLPLAHAFEHTAGQFFLLSVGTEIVYSRGPEHLAGDMQAVRPTIMAVVPRVLEVIRARMLGQVARAPAWRRALFERSLDIGRRRVFGTLRPADRALAPLLDMLVRRKIMARFGGRLRAMMSGGARLEPDLGQFFLDLGLTIMQGYGQTEAGPVVSANPAHAIRIDSVGLVLDGVELRIAEDGEILLRGDLVMDGYWLQPQATAAVIRDGWLHTGDIGTLDADGYLRITDRKKDIIVLSGGDNVSPARIEGMLMAEPEIAQAVVAGDGRAALAALVVASDGVAEPDIGRAIARVNAKLALHERVRRHGVVPAFTIDNGLLTPTLKIRRSLVLRVHAGTLQQIM